MQLEKRLGNVMILLYFKLKKWNINREKLEATTRKLWSEGFRPTSQSSPNNVGSGFDTSDSSQA